MTIIYDMPEDQYHACTDWSLHDLLALKQHGPRYIQDKKFNNEHPWERRSAMDFGTAAHALILEGQEKYESTISIRPSTYLAQTKLTKKESKERALPTDARFSFEGSEYLYVDGWHYRIEEKPWSGNAGPCKQWMADHADAPIITQDDDATIRTMRSRVVENESAAALLRCGMAEVTIRHAAGVACDVPVRCRMDFLSQDMGSKQAVAIVDYKKCRGFGAFEHQVHNFGYYRQAAFYQWMYQIETGQQLPWAWIVQEDSGSLRSRVYYPDEALLRMGHEENMKALEQVEGLTKISGPWPLDFDTTPIEIGLPRWAESFAEDEDADDDNELPY